MLTGITLIIISLLAVPSLILSRKPNAKELLDKITPYQGTIGVVFFILALLGIIFRGIFGLGWASSAPLYWFILLVANLTQLALSFLLGYGLIQQYALSKNAAAKAKGEQVLAKLAPIEGKLGIAGLIIGVLCVIVSIVY